MKDKYDIDNLPIDDNARDDIKEKTVAEIAAIKLIHTLGRMLSLWELANDEQFDEVFKKLNEIHEDINKKCNALEKRVKKLEKVA